MEVWRSREGARGGGGGEGVSNEVNQGTEISELSQGLEPRWCDSPDAMRIMKLVLIIMRTTIIW